MPRMREVSRMTSVKSDTSLEHLVMSPCGHTGVLLNDHAGTEA